MHTSLFFSRSISALDLRVNSFISFVKEMLEKCHGNSVTWHSSHFALILPVPCKVFSTPSVGCTNYVGHSGHDQQSLKMSSEEVNAASI